jgi:dTDP-4-amino-4,6-dideoxygalactose transaminase
LSAYKHLGHTPAEFPVAHRGMSRILSLPMYAELTEEQLAHVARCLTESLAS